jgi:hypothetical protein
VLVGIKKGVKTKIIAIFISASIPSFGTKFRAVASVFYGNSRAIYCIKNKYIAANKDF